MRPTARPESRAVFVNVRQVKNMPNRKRDVTDAAWLAQPGAHSRVRGSFVPPEPIRLLRDLTRTRIVLIRHAPMTSNAWRRSSKAQASSFCAMESCLAKGDYAPCLGIPGLFQRCPDVGQSPRFAPA